MQRVQRLHAQLCAAVVTEDDARAPQVVVVGGGPSGLAAAIAIKLKHAGAHVTVYEKRAAPSRDAFVILSALALSRLATMGVLEHLEPALTHIAKGNVVNERLFGSLEPRDIALGADKAVEPDGWKPVALRDVMFSMNANFVNKTCVLSDIEKALRARAAEIGVRLVLNCAIDRLVRRRAGFAAVTADDRTLEADLVVLAEGARALLGARDLSLSFEHHAAVEYHCRLDVAPLPEPNYFVAQVRSAAGGCSKALLIGAGGGAPSYLFLQVPLALVPERLRDGAFGTSEEMYARGESDGLALGDFLAAEVRRVAALWRVPSALPQWTGARSRPFVLTERTASAFAAGDNVLLVGDAGRAVTLYAGSGVQIALTVDVDLLLVAAARILGGGDRAAAMRDYDERMRAMAGECCRLNAKRFY